MMKLRTAVAAVASAVCGLAWAGPTPLTFSMTLLPGSSVAAAPGGTTGWGYSITNFDQSRWLAPVSLNHALFEYGVPNSLFDYPVVAPGATVTVAFDGLVGLFEFTWSDAAPIGFVNAGVFDIETEWWSDAVGTFYAAGTPARLTYAVTATQPDPAQVPVPGTLALTLGGLATIALTRRQVGRWRHAAA